MGEGTGTVEGDLKKENEKLTAE
eukprot:SAG22_NODE_3572_length_1636_cov_1.163956_2_plen_22_part_01